MTDISELSNNVLPVPCPVCGEHQNSLIGGFNNDGLPAGEVHCMVCRHVFKPDEYERGLKNRRQEFSILSGPVPQ